MMALDQGVRWNGGEDFLWWVGIAGLLAVWAIYPFHVHWGTAERHGILMLGLPVGCLLAIYGCAIHRSSFGKGRRNRLRTMLFIPSAPTTRLTLYTPALVTSS